MINSAGEMLLFFGARHCGKVLRNYIQRITPWGRNVCGQEGEEEGAEGDKDVQRGEGD